ncbi:MAG TPA: hypothetical protein VGS03_00420 [Candidatus Polarisedimenticolia bacterium]|jgi:hypothetical protein|nr:hypothetical protein [Candidatus Polarisedimenticolia bacterium]
MKAILRSVAGVFFGACLAIGVIILVEQISGRMYPPPPGISYGDKEAWKAFIASLPLGAFLMILVAWGLGTFAGAWVCAKVAGRAKLAHGLVLATLLLAVGVSNMFEIPHPIWMWPSAFAVFAGAGLAGGRLA